MKAQQKRNIKNINTNNKDDKNIINFEKKTHSNSSENNDTRHNKPSRIGGSNELLNKKNFEKDYKIDENMKSKSGSEINTKSKMNNMKNTEKKQNSRNITDSNIRDNIKINKNEKENIDKSNSNDLKKNKKVLNNKIKNLRHSYSNNSSNITKKSDNLNKKDKDTISIGSDNDMNEYSEAITTGNNLKRSNSLIKNVKKKNNNFSNSLNNKNLSKDGLDDIVSEEDSDEDFKNLKNKNNKNMNGKNTNDKNVNDSDDNNSNESMSYNLKKKNRLSSYDSETLKKQSKKNKDLSESSNKKEGIKKGLLNNKKNAKGKNENDYSTSEDDTNKKNKNKKSGNMKNKGKTIIENENEEEEEEEEEDDEEEEEEDEGYKRNRLRKSNSIKNIKNGISRNSKFIKKKNNIKPNKEKCVPNNKSGKSQIKNVKNEEEYSYFDEYIYSNKERKAILEEKERKRQIKEGYIKKMKLNKYADDESIEFINNPNYIMILLFLTIYKNIIKIEWNFKDIDEMFQNKENTEFGRNLILKLFFFLGRYFNSKSVFMYKYISRIFQDKQNALVKVVNFNELFPILNENQNYKNSSGGNSKKRKDKRGKKNKNLIKTDEIFDELAENEDHIDEANEFDEDVLTHEEEFEESENDVENDKTFSEIEKDNNVVKDENQLNKKEDDVNCKGLFNLEQNIKNELSNNVESKAEIVTEHMIKDEEKCGEEKDEIKDETGLSKKLFLEWSDLNTISKLRIIRMLLNLVLCESNNLKKMVLSENIDFNNGYLGKINTDKYWFIFNDTIDIEFKLYVEKEEQGIFEFVCDNDDVLYTLGYNMLKHANTKPMGDIIIEKYNKICREKRNRNRILKQQKKLYDDLNNEQLLYASKKRQHKQVEHFSFDNDKMRKKKNENMISNPYSLQKNSYQKNDRSHRLATRNAQKENIEDFENWKNGENTNISNVLEMGENDMNDEKFVELNNMIDNNDNNNQNGNMNNINNPNVDVVVKVPLKRGRKKKSEKKKRGRKKKIVIEEGMDPNNPLKNEIKKIIKVKRAPYTKRAIKPVVSIKYGTRSNSLTKYETEQMQFSMFDMNNHHALQNDEFYKNNNINNSKFFNPNIHLNNFYNPNISGPYNMHNNIINMRNQKTNTPNNYNFPYIYNPPIYNQYYMYNGSMYMYNAGMNSNSINNPNGLKDEKNESGYTNDTTIGINIRNGIMPTGLNSGMNGIGNSNKNGKVNNINENTNDLGNITNSGMKINGLIQNGSELSGIQNMGNMNRGNNDNNSNNIDSNNNNNNNNNKNNENENNINYNDSINKYNSFMPNRNNNPVNNINDHHIYNTMYNLKLPYVNNDIMNYNYNLANYQNFNYDKMNKNMFKRYPNFIPNNFPQYNNMNMYPGFNSYTMNYQSGQGSQILKNNFTNETSEFVEMNENNLNTTTTNNNNSNNDSGNNDNNNNDIVNGLENISKINESSNLNRIGNTTNSVNVGTIPDINNKENDLKNVSNELMNNDDKLCGDLQTILNRNESSNKCDYALNKNKLNNENGKIGDQNIIISNDLVNNEIGLSMENGSKNVDGNEI
ncbi:conserved Plasmodium protein, unknown function [Plasmodium berghei]|uniref:Uncharacterized protein n=2 Tax=Plasmodium berghei TaxID=5821 RepID=A0A509ARI5_PLABA|nr:conserved Plasmodium protein, unknown function [Plasmodium berghei ANKA]SCM27071.1 conserved Plasmodium protein, unknown function [Plasmodium berghei]SCN28797.1 conserved Plasmodium protein, unknown function [Plasmodium berghei]SCO64544.1 conserved Plasmodium protein, unknown function [Plasmodium berghei]VUC58680.1 conserved Plasmodium protein, unknown function [Plasmodium berghei ANKA]|eukprot:XP_034424443.1 conserved Plasmodium protein, unknown function [Plasmodium berghei ANKA]